MLCPEVCPEALQLAAQKHIRPTSAGISRRPIQSIERSWHSNEIKHLAHPRRYPLDTRSTDAIPACYIPNLYVTSQPNQCVINRLASMLPPRKELRKGG